MAIAHDTATQAASYSSTGTQTTSHAGSASAKAVVVMIEQNGTASDEVSGVTYGSVAMSRIRFDTESTEAGAVYIYFLALPPTGTQNVAMTTTASTAKRLVVSTLTATVGTPEIVGTGNTGTSTSASNPALSLTGLTASRNYQCYEVIHSGLQSMTTTPQTTPAWTLLYSNDNGSQGNGWARINNTPAGTTITGGWIAATADDYVISGVAIWENPSATVTAVAVAAPGAALAAVTPNVGSTLAAVLVTATAATPTPTVSASSKIGAGNATPTIRGTTTDVFTDAVNTVTISATTGWTGSAPQAGDILVAVIGTANSKTPTPPAGWNLQTSDVSNALRIWVMTRPFDISDTTYVWSQGASSPTAVVIYALSNAVEVIDGANSNSGTGNQTSWSTPSLSSLDGDMDFVLAAWNSGTSSLPTADAALTSGPGAVSNSAAVVYAALRTAYAMAELTSTPAYTASFGGTSTSGAAGTVIVVSGTPGGGGTSLASVAALTAIPLPTVTTASPDATVPNTVTPIPTTAAIPLPTPSADTTIAAIPVIAGGSIPLPAISADSTVVATTVAASGQIPSPTIAITPVLVAAPGATIPLPTFVGGPDASIDLRASAAFAFINKVGVADVGGYVSTYVSSGTAVGDLLIATYSGSLGSNLDTWASIGSTGFKYKVATGTDLTTLFDATDEISAAVIGIWTFRNQGPSPIETSANGSTSAGPYVAPSVTAASASDVWLVLLGLNNGSANVSSGFTSDGFVGGDIVASYGIFHKQLTASGATGTASFTSNGGYNGNASSVLVTSGGVGGLNIKVAATASIPAPTLSADSTITASLVTAVAAIPNAHPPISAAVLLSVAASALPTVDTQVIITAALVTAVTAITQPQFHATITATQVPATSSVIRPAFNVSITGLTATTATSTITGHAASASITVTAAVTSSAAATPDAAVHLYKMGAYKPNILYTLTNLTGAYTDIDDSPDTPDANALVPTGGAIVVRMGFEDHAQDMRTQAGDQKFRVVVKVP